MKDAKKLMRFFSFSLLISINLIDGSSKANKKKKMHIQE